MREIAITTGGTFHHAPDNNALQQAFSAIAVNIHVPLDDNSWVPPFFLQGMQLDSSFALGRENVSWGLSSQPPSSPPPQQALVAPPAASDQFNGGNRHDDDVDDD